MTWGTPRGRQDTGNGLGSSMASVSLGSDAPATGGESHRGTWGPQLVSEAEAGSEHFLTVLQENKQKCIVMTAGK